MGMLSPAPFFPASEPLSSPDSPWGLGARPRGVKGPAWGPDSEHMCVNVSECEPVSVSVSLCV